MAAPRLLRIAMTLVACMVAGCARGPNDGPRTETVIIAGERFHLEVAADTAAIARGLMERASISEDGGMLFIFPDVRHRSFWMKNCVVDIDVIFLDGRGTVTATHEMKVEPPRAPDENEFDYETRLDSYVSRYPAQFAIELRAGTIRRLGIEVEDRIELDLPRLKDLVR